MIDFNNSISDVFFPYKIMLFPEIYSKLVSGEPTNPINIEINLTNRCNHRCRWCTYGYLHQNEDMLNVRVAKELLKSAKATGVKSVTWTGGGEPTLHPQFLHLIEFAAELGYKQGLNTNGNKLSDPIINVLAKHFSYVRFSVDAGQNATHCYCHNVKNQFDNIIGNINHLCACRNKFNTNLIIGYSFLIDEANVNDIPLAVDIASKIGVNYIQFKPVVYYDKSNRQFNIPEFEAKIKTLLDAAQAKQTDSFKILVLQNKFENIKLEDSHFGRTYKECVGCKVMASIGANGSVDICCAFKGMKKWSIGNVNDQPFSSIWNSPRMREVINNIDIKKCPPLCKSDEINRLIYFVRTYNLNKEFI